jgi:hypothetical protein
VASMRNGILTKVRLLPNARRLPAAVALLLLLAPGAAMLAPAAAAQPGNAPTDALGDAVALARDLTEMQARDLGFAVVDGPAPQAFAAPSDAVAALLARFDVAPSAEQAEAIAVLDALPASKGEALAGVIAAYLGFEAATSGAYASADGDALAAAVARSRASAQALGLGAPADVAPSLSELGVDLAPVFGARIRVLEATEAFARVYASGEPGADAVPFPPIPGVLILDLQGRNDIHALNAALSIDVGGNDRYDNNAGGVSRGVGCARLDPFAAAVLIDLAGNDLRAGIRTGTLGCGTNGGGAGGAGFSFDLGGADLYEAGQDGANGGSLHGVGFLFDAAGVDSYDAGGWGVNGGAFGGAGLLLDAAGSDFYHSTSYGVNGGGAYGGTGALVDLSGDDVYSSLGLSGWSGGANGAAINGGIGRLVDLAGDDQYVGFSYGSNGGGFEDNGRLAKGEAPAKGLLIDASGNDMYWSSYVGVNGGAYGGAIGTLLDLSGNDSYAAADKAVNGGSKAACDQLLTCPPGIGLLLDAQGNDVYHDADGGTGADKSVVLKGPLGAQVDTCIPPLALPAVPGLSGLPPTGLPPRIAVRIDGMEAAVCAPSVATPRMESQDLTTPGQTVGPLCPPSPDLFAPVSKLLCVDTSAESILGDSCLGVACVYVPPELVVDAACEAHAAITQACTTPQTVPEFYLGKSPSVNGAGPLDATYVEADVSDGDAWATGPALSGRSLGPIPVTLPGGFRIVVCDSGAPVGCPPVFTLQVPQADLSQCATVAASVAGFKVVPETTRCII